VRFFFVFYSDANVEQSFSLTHILTHNRKSADGDNGVKRVKKQIYPSGKRGKCPDSTQSTPWSQLRTRRSGVRISYGVPKTGLKREFQACFAVFGNFFRGVGLR
jgi:hypothetical protein